MLSCYLSRTFRFKSVILARLKTSTICARPPTSANLGGVGDLFGTDGIRGIANRQLTVELAVAVARAAARVLGEGGRVRALIARDTRVSSPMLEAALEAGLCSAGADVMLAGVLPTPAVAFLVGPLEADLGVVVSASHNPWQWNGIKLFSRDGFKLPDQVEDRIEQLVHQGLPPGDRVGKARPCRQSGRIYLSHLRSTAPESLSGLKLVLDCAHGATFRLAPALFHGLGAWVAALNCRPNGQNINRGCGSLHPEGIGRRVIREDAHAGLAFDGDGDRLIMVDETGQVIDGDQMLAMLASHLKRGGRLPGNLVVGTVMSNLGLEAALSRDGCRLARTRVGDRYVLEEIERAGAILGGEPSGHLILRDRATTGDGLLTALAVLELMRETGRPLSELARAMERYPQCLLNVRVARVEGWQDDPHLAQVIEQARQEIGEGRVVVRASGTEPVIRVMVEAREARQVEVSAQRIASVLKQRFGGD